MREIIRNFIVLTCFYCSCFHAQGQDLTRQVRNIQAFCKIAGYVQFFSAADNSQSLAVDWDNIYINGVKVVKVCKNDQELLDSLRQIFEPLEPTIEFSYQGEKQTKLIGNKLADGHLKIFKQNAGLELYSGKTNAYKSIRVNRRSPYKQNDQMEFLLVDTLLADVCDVDFLTNISLGQDLDMLVFDDEKLFLKKHLSKDDSLIKITFPDVRNGRVQVKIKVDSDMEVDIQSSSIRGLSMHSKARLEQDDIKKINLKYTVVLQGFDRPLYDNFLDISDSVHTAVTDKLSMSFPLCLYGDSLNTYPISLLSNYRYDKTSNSDYFKETGILHNEVKVANLLMIWNAFRYSFAYLTLNEREHQQLLEDVIRASLGSNDLDAYVDNVWYMLRTYSDSHIFFDLAYIRDQTAYTAPIDLQLINNKLYVKDVFTDSIKSLINIGDEVLAIDGKPASEVFQDHLLKTTGSDHFRTMLTIVQLLNGPKESQLSLALKQVGSKVNKKISVSRNQKSHAYLPGNSGYLKRDNGYLDSNLYYFDLTRSFFDATALNKIAENCANIIIDMRGYLVENDYKKMVRNLIKDSVSVQRIWHPNIISPTETKWKSGVDRHTPVGGALSKANIFFLADASTQSAPETFLELMKYKKVGPIIGEHTSGANGTINHLLLPGKMSVTFSGQRFKNSDGTQHHKIGIPPDYKIEYTLENILKREDPYIIKVKELIKEQVKWF